MATTCCLPISDLLLLIAIPAPWGSDVFLWEGTKEMRGWGSREAENVVSMYSPFAHTTVSLIEVFVFVHNPCVHVFFPHLPCFHKLAQRIHSDHLSDGSGYISLAPNNSRFYSYFYNYVTIVLLCLSYRLYVWSWSVFFLRNNILFAKHKLHLIDYRQ